MCPGAEDRPVVVPGWDDHRLIARMPYFPIGRDQRTSSSAWITVSIALIRA